jgi:hypothetical protein
MPERWTYEDRDRLAKWVTAAEARARHRGVKAERLARSLLDAKLQTALSRVKELEKQLAAAEGENRAFYNATKEYAGRVKDLERALAMTTGILRALYTADAAEHDDIVLCGEMRAAIRVAIDEARAACAAAQEENDASGS